ncbi:DUF58 domain-containing protein [Thermopirellula anaerolimosa]
MSQGVLAKYLDSEALDRIARQRWEPRGLVQGNLAGGHRSPLAGFAVEFVGHRQYVWGDDPKHIDWRVFFNRDRLVVKQYAMETNFVCHFVLDASASMTYGTGDQQKLRYAARLAMTLGYFILHQGDKISLATFDRGLLAFIPPGNSPAQFVRMTEHLETLDPREKTDIGRALAEIGEHFHRREIVVVLSDFFCDPADLEKAVQQWRYQRHEVVLLHVLHHDELAFEFEGQVKFVGLELPDELLTRPDELRRSYLRAFQDFQERLAAICQRNRVEYLLVDTSRPPADVLADYLMQRSRFRRAR